MAFLRALLNDEPNPRRAAYFEFYKQHNRLSEPFTATHLVNHFVRAWGHQFIYDADTLMALLRDAGFVSVTRAELTNSTVAGLQGLAKLDRMCGIAGFFSFSGEPADPITLARMTDVQRHRGPDDQGFRLFSLRSGTSEELAPGDLGRRPGFEGALGFNRLKILDLSQCGHQPMMNADGTVMIAFNGEIYNAFDYRRELERAGFTFRSRTDTEVILYLYEKYGLDGMSHALRSWPGGSTT